MYDPLTPTQAADLERMVDMYGLRGVLDALSSIAFEKAEHVRTNWDDESLAREWEMKASKVGLVADSM